MKKMLIKSKKSWIAFTHDCLMAFISLPIALFLRVGTDIAIPFFSDNILRNCTIFLIIAASVFSLSGLYRGIWRYASQEDLIAIAKSTSIVVLLFVVTFFFIDRLNSLPRSLPFIHWLVLMVLIGGPRFLYKNIRDKLNSFSQKKHNPQSEIPVLIYGTEDHADAFIREVKRNPSSTYKIVGIISRKEDSVGRRLHDISVLSTLSNLEGTLDKLKQKNITPRHFVITNTDKKPDSNTFKKLLTTLSKRGIRLSRIPDITEFKSSNDNQIDLKPINLEDLLGRHQNILDKPSMQQMIKDKKILITGAGGSIGSELVRQVLELSPKAVTLIDHSEYNLYQIAEEVKSSSYQVPDDKYLCDVKNFDKLFTIFNKAQPDIVFHAAALKHVHIVEHESEEGILTNVLGTKNVADLCQKFSVDKMVMISTDKAVNPSSIMGATKRLAESYCQALDSLKNNDTKFITVRFGNVLGSSGSVIPLFKQQLEKGGPLTVTHPEATRYFMTIREAVELVLQAAASTGKSENLEKGKLFVLDMGEPIRIQDLARQMIRLAGLKPDQDIKIDYVGLRPGERLHEILLHDNEELQETNMPSILLASPRFSEYKILEKALSKLFKYAQNYEKEKAILALEKLVPEYNFQQKPFIKETDKQNDRNIV